MEQAILGMVVLSIVLVVKRKDVFILRWKPNRGTWVALGTGMLAFVLSTALLLLEPASIIARLLLYGGIWLICGVVIPWGYVILVERDTVAALGIRREKCVRSLLISLGLAGLFSMVIFFQANLTELDWREAGRAAVVLIFAGGLFELFLYYGFIHIRLAQAFGSLPAILIAAAIYVLWHTGTQLPMEPDPWLGVLKLLGVGVMYQAVFSLTYNLLVIWPLFMGVGVMIDFMVNIGELESISATYPWAVATVLGMGLSITVIWLLSRKQMDYGVMPENLSLPD